MRAGVIANFSFVGIDRMLFFPILDITSMHDRSFATDEEILQNIPQEDWQSSLLPLPPPPRFIREGVSVLLVDKAIPHLPICISPSPYTPPLLPTTTVRKCILFLTARDPSSHSSPRRGILEKIAFFPPFPYPLANPQLPFPSVSRLSGKPEVFPLPFLYIVGFFPRCSGYNIIHIIPLGIS